MMPHRTRTHARAACVAVALSLGFTAFVPAPARAQTASPGDPYIEQMTWTEIRDAIAAGKTVAIVPTGGTEQNGPHMVMGKHNYIVEHAAGLMAKRLGNALVAPTVAWVPEGDYNRPGWADKPGVISLPSPSYDRLLEAAARSLAHHGFTHVLFIGDSGGNQNGMQATADKLNAEWAGGPNRVFALTDFYRMGQQYSRIWLQAEYGYSMDQIGSHAGITDTSAVMYVFPDGVRNDLRMPQGGHPDAGVTGDPTLATPEIGKRVVEFKVLAGLEQYRQLQGGQGGRGGN